MRVQLTDLINDQRVNEDDQVLKIDLPQTASYQMVPEIDVVLLEFGEDLVLEVTRSGNDAILVLENGETIRLLDYFDTFPTFKALNFTGAEALFLVPSGSGLAAGLTGIAILGQGGEKDASSTPTIDPTNGTILSGTGEPGGTVSITYGSPAVTVQAPVDPTTGIWTIVPVTPIPHGTAITVTLVGPTGPTGGPATGTVDGQVGDPTIDPTDGTSVSGTGEPGATVTITYGSPEQTIETTVGTNGLWTISPTDPIPHGTVINATQVDPLGNTSRPATGIVGGQNGDPTIDPTNGTTVSGTGEPGATVTITYGSPEQTIETTVGTNGLWTISPTDPIPHGTVINATQVGPTGNTSGPATGTVDSQIGDPTIDPTNGTSVSGTGEPGATVTITYGSPEQTIETTVGTNGLWTISPTDPIPHGTVINATQIDPSGNTGGPATGTVDSQIGDPTIDPTDGTTVTGTGEVGATVTITFGSPEQTIETTVGTNGVWTISPTDPIPAGTVINATQVDPTGNISNPANETVTANMPTGFKISGSDSLFDFLSTGGDLHSAGDVNGDGFDDFILSVGSNKIAGKDYAEPAPAGITGSAYVILGGGDGQDIDLTNLDPSEGFKISGTQEISAGRVTSVGDVNGDGLDDVLVSEAESSKFGIGGEKGFIVFGQTTFADVDLAAISAGDGSLGFEIFDSRADTNTTAGQAFVGLGKDVTGLGDVNGDGIADFAISNDPRSFNAGYLNNVYVVFGKTNFGSSFDLADLENSTDGFRIHGQQFAVGDIQDQANYAGNRRTDRLGQRIENGGDINGDGYDDILIGSFLGKEVADQSWISSSENNNFGATHIIFGGTDTADIFAADLMLETTDRGFSVLHAREEFASIGDVNHDGLDDMIFAASDVQEGNTLTVVYGRTAFDNFSVNDIVSDLTLGYRIVNLPLFPTHVSDAGDFNGDGIHDFIASSPGISGDTAYVIFGQAGGSDIDMSSIMSGTADGFAITNSAFYDDNYGEVYAFAKVGESIASAGDINGDGFDDLLVSAPYVTDYDYAAYSDGDQVYAYYGRAGATYVIFGNDRGDNAPIDIADITNTTGTATIVDQAGTTGDDVITGTAEAELLVGNLGNDTITGGGGSDVILAGAGDDVVHINASNIAALEGGAQDGKLSHLEGGNGDDRLVINGSGVTLDFGNIDFDRVNNFETIDITGSGDNALNIGLGDLLHLSDTSDTFRILGDAGDTVELSGMSTATYSQETIGSLNFDVYTLGHERIEIHDVMTIQVI